jgi:hypothetical protein
VNVTAGLDPLCFQSFTSNLFQVCSDQVWHKPSELHKSRLTIDQRRLVWDYRDHQNGRKDCLKDVEQLHFAWQGSLLKIPTVAYAVAEDG